MRPAGEAFAREAAKLPALSVPYRNGGDTQKGMDCQGLVEYCLRQLGVRKNWRGSNAMWRDMVWRGTPEDCRKAFGRIPKGAFLYIISSPLTAGRKCGAMRTIWGMQAMSASIPGRDSVRSMPPPAEE